MSFLDIYFSENGVVNVKTTTHNFRKRASDVSWDDMVEILAGMSESDWSVRIVSNIAGDDHRGAINVIGLLISCLEERKEVIRQDKFRCVVKLDVMFKSIIEEELVEAIHDLIMKLPNLNDICLQTYIEWGATFKYIIEKSQVHTLSLVTTDDRRAVSGSVSMIERIVGVFESVNKTGRITKLEIKGEHISDQTVKSVGKILQNFPQLQVFSINNILFIYNLMYFAGHRLELDDLDNHILSVKEMQKILTWANASLTLKVIKFRKVGFNPDSIVALRDDIEKDEPRTCIQKLIFERCLPVSDCEAIKKIMDYRNKAFELASFGKEKNLPPTIVQYIIISILGLNE